MVGRQKIIFFYEFDKFKFESDYFIKRKENKGNK